MIKNPGEITLDDALNICKEALKKGRELDLMPLTVTVVDVAGVIRATMAEEGSGLIRSDIAYAKAWTCLAFNVSSNTLSSFSYANNGWRKACSNTWRDVNPKRR